MSTSDPCTCPSPTTCPYCSRMYPCRCEHCPHRAPMKPTPDETIRALRDSLDADVLRDDYPQELVEQELREAGCDPEALVARCRPQVDALLAKRKESELEALRAEVQKLTQQRSALCDELTRLQGEVTASRRIVGAATSLYDEALCIERKTEASGIREKLTAADVVRALHDAVWALAAAEAKSTEVTP